MRLGAQRPGQETGTQEQNIAEVSMSRKIYCVFCGAPIEPEPCMIANGNEKNAQTGYLFQCENLDCEAIYESNVKNPFFKIYSKPITWEGIAI